MKDPILLRKRLQHFLIRMLFFKKESGVIKVEETLKQILVELQKVNHRLDRLEKGQQDLKTDVTDLKLGQDQLKDNLINGLGQMAFETVRNNNKW